MCRTTSSPPVAAWNLSQVLLGLERYDEAFSLSESRLSLAECPAYRDPAHSYWDGKSSPEYLYVWSEQGFGDTLQYLRWCLPLISDQNVVLEVESPLVSLVSNGFGKGFQVCPKKKIPSALSSSSEHISLLSLPSRLGLNPGSSVSGPYLVLGEGRKRLANNPPKVGLVWAAGRSQDDPFTLREYKKRSLTSHALGCLVQGLYQKGAELVPLQIGPDHVSVRHWSGFFKSEAISQAASFEENARWILDLDLLISVDTAAAHLAGALGQPCWLLLPFSADPRWLRDRSDSPWYPSFRLFRQPSSGQWLPVVDQVLEAFIPWWNSVSGS